MVMAAPFILVAAQTQIIITAAANHTGLNCATGYVVNQSTDR